MYKDYYEKFIQSQVYHVFECDIIFQQLRELLVRNMTEKLFLDIEELLHSEILFKLELGFQYGFQNGIDLHKNIKDKP